MALSLHMPGRGIAARLAGVAEAVARLRAGGNVAQAIERWQHDAAATRFHLEADPNQPAIVAILGGTGTGKSTMVNRLLEANLTAASFRRTFTSGAIAFLPADGSRGLAKEWMGLPQETVEAANLPARGRQEVVLVVLTAAALAQRITLVDTPDLDGDQPAHLALADRVFRWAQAVVFLVTPEKYQMTELLPYYRLATRYGVPALFVMNKAENDEALADYAQLLARPEMTGSEARVYAVPRDDATWQPPAERGLADLRAQVMQLRPAEGKAREAGLATRLSDLAGRLVDQVIAPLRQEKREADRLSAALKAMETPDAGVDVNPLTQQLQRRMQQRSVLYLMGPARMLSRARQVPGLLVRLPRAMWDVLVSGKGVKITDPAMAGEEQKLPDFRGMLMDQFSIVQSRIDDVLRSSPTVARWLAEGHPTLATYRVAQFPLATAGDIADQELAELKAWLEKRWNATPRDTALLMRLLRVLPGGERLAKWTEAAPYLLALIVATHHALFGPVDMGVMAGFGLATWIMERLSNEVASHTRATNRKIAERFAQLAHQQIQRVSEWLKAQTTNNVDLDKLEEAAAALQEN